MLLGLLLSWRLKYTSPGQTLLISVFHRHPDERCRAHTHDAQRQLRLCSHRLPSENTLYETWWQSWWPNLKVMLRLKSQHLGESNPDTVVHELHTTRSLVSLSSGQFLPLSALYSIPPTYGQPCVYASLVQQANHDHSYLAASCKSLLLRSFLSCWRCSA